MLLFFLFFSKENTTLRNMPIPCSCRRPSDIGSVMTCCRCGDVYTCAECCQVVFVTSLDRALNMCMKCMMNYFTVAQLRVRPNFGRQLEKL